MQLQVSSRWKNERYHKFWSVITSTSPTDAAPWWQTTAFLLVGVDFTLSLTKGGTGVGTAQLLKRCSALPGEHQLSELQWIPYGHSGAHWEQHPLCLSGEGKPKQTINQTAKLKCWVLWDLALQGSSLISSPSWCQDKTIYHSRTTNLWECGKLREQPSWWTATAHALELCWV